MKSGTHHCGDTWGFGFDVDVKNCYRTSYGKKRVDYYVKAKVSATVSGHLLHTTWTGRAKAYGSGKVTKSDWR